ncbi:HAD-IC family P-type ATPase [Herbiconiux sp. CPCC 203407]|uniref:HAD-IC family P-type ATPase n=1 Tax=Herbiconiux oxytropis TaxID=2970915 RepID=A0AA41XGI7_9MICO|nr:HAD-IC family P-type ATPase [Herbiconiux oxytropis]MCS5720470.1 HAD-IC family P-type ATPase [Herbiconiux oxytropis]MCS5726043.1 HAD-IC family P-type ATPase [Herbiconiux oxytropis]
MPGDPGLSLEEVASRIAAGQTNVADDTTSRSVGSILRENVFTFFNGILTVCFVAVLLLGDLGDGLFFGIVVANSLIGIVQELRAKASLERLALLAAPETAVRRAGDTVVLKPEQVVLGDLMLLRPGDQITADARLGEVADLLVDESMLTGESEPIAKSAGDPVLSGSFVVSGTAEARVTAVGADSYANTLTREIRKHSLVHSELRAATTRILVYLTWLLVPVIVVVLVGRVLTYAGGDLGDLAVVPVETWRQAGLDAVASVVGMIPEGLVLLTSLAFGVAVIQLGRQKVLVQELAAVEVLARVDVLCLDKTGTLTTGEIGFERLVVVDDAVPEGAVDTVLGLIAHDVAANQTALALRERYPEAAEGTGPSVAERLPFSSRRACSAITVVDQATGTEQTWLLGAPERLLASHPDALGTAQGIAALGRRTLALARAGGRAGDWADEPAGGPLEAGVRPAAIVVFHESVRPDARPTLDFFAEQDVRVIVLSGDNPVTVGRIAGELGLEHDAVDASALTADDELDRALRDSSIYGRVAPEQKRRVVHALQAEGRTVAMTGDGVNDAMAIKDADLGIAMGNATPATRAVSRIVLLEGRFDRLPTVLSYARRVIANVERVSNLFLAKTVYGIVLALVSAVLLWKFPFLPRQMTLVSSLAIGIPSFFLALAPNRRRYRPGVLKRVLAFSIPTGVIASAAVVAAFAVLQERVPLAEARSLTTISLFIVSLWVLCVLARPLTSWRLGLVLAVAVAFALAFVVPTARDFFQLELGDPLALMIALVAGAVGAAGVELWYRVARRRDLVFDRE